MTVHLHKESEKIRIKRGVRQEGPKYREKQLKFSNTFYDHTAQNVSTHEILLFLAVLS